MSMMGAGLMTSMFGGLIGGIGASDSAQATNQAGRQSEADLMDNLYWGMLQQKKDQLGSAGAKQWYEANVPKDVQDRLFGTADYKVAELPAQPGPGSRRSTPNDVLTKKVAGTEPALGGGLPVNQRVVSGIKGKFNKDAFFSDTTPGYLSQMQGLAETQGKFGMQNLQGSRDIAAQAQSFGQGERARIERDSAQGLQNANQAGSAQLAGAGLGGSSLGANMTQGNAAAMGRQKADALGSLDDRTNQFLTGLRQNTLNMGLANQQQNLALQQAPIAARMGMSSSAAFNPFLSRDTTQYYPGLSPGGKFLQSFGNSLAGTGGTMTGYGLQSQRGRGGGGGGGMGMSGMGNLSGAGYGGAGSALA